MEMDADGNSDGQVDSNGLQWRWMEMQMALYNRTVIDDN